MSISFSVVFEADVPPFKMLGYDTSLAGLKDELDRVAEENGLTPLGTFESYDPSDFEDFADEGEAPEAPELPPTEWFEASAGLDAVRALVAYLNAHPHAVSGQASVLEDLAAIESNLAAAKEAGVRFRLAVIL